MAFPTVVGTGSWQAGAAGVVPHMAVMPAGILAGDLIIVAWMRGGVNNSGTVDPKWTDTTYSPRGIASSIGSRFVYAVADGSESGATLNLVSVSGGSRGCSATIVLRAWDASKVPEVSAVPGSVTAGTAVDPPALTPSFGALDILWLVAAFQNGTPTLSSAPTNYGNNIPSVDSNNTLSLSRRTLNAATEDPGVVTYTAGSSNALAITVAVAGIMAAAAVPRSFAAIV